LIQKGLWVDPKLVKKPEMITLTQFLSKYADEVTSRKKGEKQELVRINKWKDHDFASMAMTDIKASHIAEYISTRRKTISIRGTFVSDATIRQEVLLISAVYKVASTDWAYENLVNPVSRLKKLPAPSKWRDRRLNEGEWDKLLSALTTRCRNDDIVPVVKFGLAMGMRQSEIIGMPATSTFPAKPGLTWENIDFIKNEIFVPDTKSVVDKPRDRTPPIFPEALKILQSIPRPITGGQVFKVTQDGLIRAFAQACDDAKIEDLHFHDLRHEFTSRLDERGIRHSVIMAITGHSSAEMLKRYTHAKKEDMQAVAKMFVA
jgi:integrase